MITFIERTDGSDLESFFSKKYNLNYSDFLDTYPSQFVRGSINSWDEIETIISANDIFAAESASDEIYIIDINDLDINKKVLNFLHSIDSENSNVHLYSGTRSKLLAGDKRLWKTADFNYNTTPKLSTNEKQKIALEYIQTHSHPIPVNITSQIVTTSSDIREVLDQIDFLSLSGDVKNAWDNIKKKNETLPFMLTFDPNQKHKIRDWLRFANKDELQLALSLIFTKLQKSNSNESEAAMKEVILTDQKVKNDNRIGAETWYKYMLWAIINQKYEQI